jgi:hypothetical protein
MLQPTVKVPTHAIRVWRADAAPGATAAGFGERAATLLSAFLGAAQADMPVVRHLQRALRTERRLARHSDRRYDVDRHAALARACAALARQRRAG